MVFYSSLFLEENGYKTELLAKANLRHRSCVGQSDIQSHRTALKCLGMLPVAMVLRLP